MQLFGYSERGIANAFCYDCLHSGNGENLLSEVLKKACFPLLERSPSSAGVAKATFLVEQSLSQFGDCDLVILCDLHDGTKSVIFCEFKRGLRWTLKRHWAVFTNKIESKVRKQLTSNLFCQLYFKQRFCSALANCTNEDIDAGLDFDAPLDIRRKKGGTGRKIGVNRTVLRVVDMIRPYAKMSFYLMVTPDDSNHEELKSFLDGAKGVQAKLRGWSIERWGHLSLSALDGFCRQRPDCFAHTVSIFEFNRDQLYSVRKQTTKS